MRSTWPTARLVHLPVHASWLNQIKIYFSIVQRKVIKPGDFVDLEELAARLLAFQDRYNTTAEPLRLALHPQVPRPPPRTAHPPQTTGRMTPDVSTESSTRRAPWCCAWSTPAAGTEPGGCRAFHRA